MEGEDEGDSHDPHKPREDEVGHRQAIPLAVVEEPVATSSIVDKDHDGERHPTGKKESKNAYSWSDVAS